MEDALICKANKRNGLMGIADRKKKREREGRVPVEEKRRREENERGKSIGIKDKDEVRHPMGHGCFAHYH